LHLFSFGLLFVLHVALALIQELFFLLQRNQFLILHHHVLDESVQSVLVILHLLLILGHPLVE
jgi:hypothetical protein